MSSDFDYTQQLLDGIKPLCRESIATMRRFLDDAEREVNREQSTPEQAICAVTKKIAWGFANASGYLDSAVSKLEDVRKINETATENVSV